MDIAGIWTQIQENLPEDLKGFLLRVLGAIVVLIVGFWLIKRLVRLTDRIMERSNFSAQLRPFFRSLVNIGLRLLLIFSVISIVGIDVSSFVAIFAAAGFAIGIALQGSLENFAAGVLILFFRPYRIGDLISLHDQMGYVEEIQLFNTLIRTLDNKQVIMPNRMASGEVITNYSTKPYLRVDLEITMPYVESFPRVEQVILAALKDVPGVLAEPAPTVGILTFDSHNVVLAVRPFCEPDVYWDVYFGTTRALKAAFNQADIQVAYSEGIELGTIGD